MLVLSREKCERIMIGNDIVITVVEIQGNRVRLGISAPDEVELHREEVFVAIQRVKATAKARLEKTTTGEDYRTRDERKAVG